MDDNLDKPRIKFVTENQKQTYIKAGPENMRRVRRGFDKEVKPRKTVNLDLVNK